MRIFKRGWGPEDCSFFLIFLFLSYGYCLSLKLRRFGMHNLTSPESSFSLLYNINERGAFKGSAKDLSITPRAAFRAHFWRSSPSPVCDFRIQMETSKGTSRCLVLELQNTWKNNFSQSQLIIIEPIYKNNNGLKIGMGWSSFNHS